MKKFIEKYRVHIGIFLVAVILIGGLTLIFEKKSLVRLLSRNADEKSDNKEILDKISSLEERVAKLEENQSPASSGTVAGTNAENSEQSEKININTADQITLETLPGIGEKRASDIINYRETNGDFEDISEIKNIKGIGDSIYSQIKDQITVE